MTTMNNSKKLLQHYVDWSRRWDRQLLLDRRKPLKQVQPCLLAIALALLLH